MRHTPNKTLTQFIPCPMFPFLVPLTVRAPVIDPGNIKIYLLTERFRASLSSRVIVISRLDLDAEPPAR
jgi:hypothetical protein